MVDNLRFAIGPGVAGSDGQQPVFGDGGRPPQTPPAPAAAADGSWSCSWGHAHLGTDARCSTSGDIGPRTCRGCGGIGDLDASTRLCRHCFGKRTALPPLVVQRAQLGSGQRVQLEQELRVSDAEEEKASADVLAAIDSLKAALTRKVTAAQHGAELESKLSGRAIESAYAQRVEGLRAPIRALEPLSRVLSHDALNAARELGRLRAPQTPVVLRVPA